MAVALLDPARFVAAMMVVLYHYCAFFRLVTPDGTNRPYPQLLDIAQYGYLGVQLFFLISGFVIFRSVGERTATSFVLARVRRLYPAFLVCCCMTWLVLRWSRVSSLNLDSLLYGLTMVNGVIDSWRGTHTTYVDGVYWTLTVEWKFYILVVLYVALRRWLSLEVFLWIWLGSSLLYLSRPTEAWMDTWLIAPWAPYFIAGATAHSVQRRGWNAHLALLAAFALLAGVWQSILEFAFLHQRFELPGRSVTCALVVCAMYVFMFWPVTRAIPWSLSRPRMYLLLGAMSYPIYLLHSAIGGVAFATLWTQSSRWSFLGIAIVLLLLGAWMTHEWVERPIWRLLSVKTRYRLA